MDKFVAPAQAPSPESQGLPDCNGTLRYYKDIPRVAVNVSYNATTNASALAEARYQLKLSLQQPMYPIGATNVVFNTTVYNTLQQYGTYPRYVTSQRAHTTVLPSHRAHGSCRRLIPSHIIVWHALHRTARNTTRPATVVYTLWCSSALNPQQPSTHLLIAACVRLCVWAVPTGTTRSLVWP